MQCNNKKPLETLQYSRQPNGRLCRAMETWS